jgi:basic membrane lipoprotein Med (substrate-binding protein (PBP1-ABC) superfamily)
MDKLPYVNFNSSTYCMQLDNSHETSIISSVSTAFTSMISDQSKKIFPQGRHQAGIKDNTYLVLQTEAPGMYMYVYALFEAVRIERQQRNKTSCCKWQ